MTLAIVNVPDWQLTIRAAQAELFAVWEQQQQLDEARQAAEQREQDAKDADGLKRALAYFDIASAPVKNEWVLGSYRFQLVNGGYQLRKVYKDPAKKPSFVLGQPKQEPNPDDMTDVVDFWLEVEHVDSGEHQEYGVYSQRRIEVRGQRLDANWTNVRADLADALDYVDAQVTYALANKARWEASQQMQADESSAKTPTLAEQLESLMRQIAREEINRHYEF